MKPREINHNLMLKYMETKEQGTMPEFKKFKEKWKKEQETEDVQQQR